MKLQNLTPDEIDAVMAGLKMLTMVTDWPTEIEEEFPRAKRLVTTSHYDSLLDAMRKGDLAICFRS